MPDPKDVSWTAAEIEQASVITGADVLRALALIDEASAELGDMVRSEEYEP